MSREFEMHNGRNDTKANVTNLYARFSEEVTIMCRRSLAKDIDDSFSASKSLKYPYRQANGSSLWIAEPTTTSIIVYSVIIPIVSTLGIIGNALILVILNKRNSKASTFTYLVVLAGADLVTCALLLFSGLARGIFWCKSGWLEFDAFVHLPVGSISSNITVWAAVCVTVDRLVIVCSLPRCTPPKFCNQGVARKMMIFSGIFATLINLPYCFIYTYNEHGELVTTHFFHSRFYNWQNWLQFILFGLIPAIFLLIANAFMCLSVRRTLKRRQVLLQRKLIREGNRLESQARMTIMLVGIVLVFLVGEVPTHLASRRSAVSLLYGGDPTKVQEKFMENFRMIATLLNTIASSGNFVVYCLMCCNFLYSLKCLFTGKDPCATKNKTCDKTYTCEKVYACDRPASMCQPTEYNDIFYNELFLP